MLEGADLSRAVCVGQAGALSTPWSSGSVREQGAFSCAVRDLTRECLTRSVSLLQSLSPLAHQAGHSASLLRACVTCPNGRWHSAGSRVGTELAYTCTASAMLPCASSSLPTASEDSGTAVSVSSGGPVGSKRGREACTRKG